jgi:hypothetical protein
LLWIQVVEQVHERAREGAAIVAERLRRSKRVRGRGPISEKPTSQA